MVSWCLHKSHPKRPQKSWFANWNGPQCLKITKNVALFNLGNFQCPKWPILAFLVNFLSTQNVNVTVFKNHKKVVLNMVQFNEFLKTYRLQSNSVTSQVNFIRTKIGGKSQNWKIQVRHFGCFSNTVKWSLTHWKITFFVRWRRRRCRKRNVSFGLKGQVPWDTPGHPHVFLTKRRKAKNSILHRTHLCFYSL